MKIKISFVTKSEINIPAFVSFGKRTKSNWKTEREKERERGRERERGGGGERDGRGKTDGRGWGLML